MSSKQSWADYSDRKKKDSRATPSNAKSGMSLFKVEDDLASERSKRKGH
jgi:hypothetical protein